MVYVERLYGDWDDDGIIKSWIDQKTIDCCKLNSQGININSIYINKITNRFNPKIKLINNTSMNNTGNKLNSSNKLNTSKKLNTKINANNDNDNGEYYRRNKNFNKKFKIKYKGKY
jgi:hypothetical protein